MSDEIYDGPLDDVIVAMQRGMDEIGDAVALYPRGGARYRGLCPAAVRWVSGTRANHAAVPKP